MHVERQGNLLRVEFAIPSSEENTRAEDTRTMELVRRIPPRVIAPTAEVVRFLKKRFPHFWNAAGKLAFALRRPEGVDELPTAYVVSSQDQLMAREACQVLSNVVFRRETALVFQVRFYLFGDQLVAIRRTDDDRLLEQAAAKFCGVRRLRSDQPFPWLQLGEVCAPFPRGMQFVRECRAELRTSGDSDKLFDLRFKDEATRSEFLFLISDERSRRWIEGTFLIQFASIYPHKAIVAHRRLRRGESDQWDRATSERFQLNQLNRLGKTTGSSRLKLEA